MITVLDGLKRRHLPPATSARSTKTLASLMGPALIVSRHFINRRVVARAVGSICQEIVVLETCGEAKVWLDCARSYYVILYPTDGDRSYVELVKYIGDVGYRLPVVILGERDKEQRRQMREIASDLQMTIHTFPCPVDFGVLRVLLADQRSKTAGLPVAHIWGGVKVDTVVARRRSKSDAGVDGRYAKAQ